MEIVGTLHEEDFRVWKCRDVAIDCFRRLDVSSLCTASKVNRDWNSIASSEDVWRAKMEILCGPSIPLTLPDRRLTMAGCGSLWKRLFASTIELMGSWLAKEGLPAVGVAWSSQAGEHSIDWTQCEEFYWSSQPVIDPNTEESLTFKLCQPLCIVTGVEIAPAVLRRVYAPCQIQVDVGFDESQFHFTSHVEVVEDEPITVKLRFEGLVVGSHVRVRLRGMRQPMAEQTDGEDLYCMAIRRISVLGVPIGLVQDNLLAEALICNAFVHKTFRDDVFWLLKPPIGEELQLEEIVAGFRAQFGIRHALWDFGGVEIQPWYSSCLGPSSPKVPGASRW